MSEDPIPYGSCYRGNFIAAEDLIGREVECEIERVAAPNEVMCEDGRPVDKPVIYFAGKTKGLILNKTNAKRIILKHRADPRDLRKWVGIKVVLTTEEAYRPDMLSKGPVVRVKIK